MTNSKRIIARLREILSILRVLEWLDWEKVNRFHTSQQINIKKSIIPLTLLSYKNKYTLLSKNGKNKQSIVEKYPPTHLSTIHPS